MKTTLADVVEFLSAAPRDVVLQVNRAVSLRLQVIGATMKLALGVGDLVEWTHQGVTKSGTVAEEPKVRGKYVVIQTSTGRWRVSPSLLTLVEKKV